MKLSVVILLQRGPHHRRDPRAVRHALPEPRSSWWTMARPTAVERSSGRPSGRAGQGHLSREEHGEKGCLRTGIREATGDIVVIQDADLEYDPGQYPTLSSSPSWKNRADVVFASPVHRGRTPAPLWFSLSGTSIGNKVLTGLSNMLTNVNLTDMETMLQGIPAERSHQSITIEKIASASGPDHGQGGQARGAASTRWASRTTAARTTGEEDRLEGRPLGAALHRSTTSSPASAREASPRSIGTRAPRSSATPAVRSMWSVNRSMGDAVCDRSGVIAADMLVERGRPG